MLICLCDVSLHMTILLIDLLATICLNICNLLNGAAMLFYSENKVVTIETIHFLMSFVVSDICLLMKHL